MPTPKEVLDNPDFQGLPPAEKIKVMNSISPDFAQLPDAEKGRVVGGVQQQAATPQEPEMSDYPGPMGLNALTKPIAKFVGNTIMEQGPKAMGAVIGGTLGSPLGPVGIIGGAGLGAAAVGGIEDIAHNRRKSVGEAVTDRVSDVAMGSMQEAGPALKGAALQMVDKLSPKGENLLIRGIKPTNRKTDFRQTLQRAVPDVDRSSLAAGHPVEKLEDLEPLISHAKKKIWLEYSEKLKAPKTAADAIKAKAKGFLGKAGNAQERLKIQDEPAAIRSLGKDVEGYKGVAGEALHEAHDVNTIDGNKVADAMESVITKRFSLQNPDKAEAIRKVASTYRRSIPLSEAEDFLQGANNDLSSFYAKNKVGQATAARDPEWGHVVKEAETLRKELYAKLDELGEGAAELKRRYGSLSSLQEEVLRRKNVGQRQNPQSLAEQISIAQGVGRGLKSAANLDFGDAAMAVGQPLAAKWIKNRNTTDALVKRGFASYRKGITKEPADDALLRLLPILTRQAGTKLGEDEGQ